MSSGRNNEPPAGRVLRAKPSFSKASTASPLTPRLAGSSTASKRDPSPRRTFLKSGSTSRNPSPEKSIITPAKTLPKDKSTPISASARPTGRPGGVSTPGSAAGTPGSLRNTPILRPRLAAQPSSYAREETPTGRGAQSAAAVPTISHLASEAGNNATIRSNSIDDVTIKNSAPMFFHADDARSRERPLLAPAPAAATASKRPAAFFYANGQKEESTPARALRPNSPAMSMIGSSRPLAPAVRTGTSEIGFGTRSGMKSPTLNAISFAHSPFTTSPLTTSPPLLSPALGKIDYLNTPSATLNVAKRWNDRSNLETPLPATPSPNALGVTIDNTPRTPDSANSPSRHVKSSSICIVPTESPNSLRKRSATWAENKADGVPFISKLESVQVQNDARNQCTSPSLQRTHTSPTITTSPKMVEPPQSPSRDQIDFAAGARRERKVLDLEISNSSLLAINRSLEREMKKQKAELKRYRRLSRAGRFSAAVRGLDGHDDDGLLPHIDGALEGRPSSPFEEEVSDMDSSNGDDSEDEDVQSGENNVSKEEKQRAKDEAQLKADLRKHRELLLDTARMNRSLQRCLTWTEDLIKDGKKALDRAIQSSEVQLGGRVIDIDDELLAEDLESEHEEAIVEDAATPADDYTGLEAFLGKGPWRERLSAQSDSTSRDSVMDMNKSPSHLTHTLPLAPPPAIRI